MGELNLIHRVICSLFLTALIIRNHAIVVDVKAKGAKGDGKTDDGPAIMEAWKEACGAVPPSSILIPPGTYMVFPLIQLNGPCKGPIGIEATGATIKAPSNPTMFKNDSWIVIAFVDKLTMTGGTFDGQGQDSWRNNKCNDCQKPANLRFGFVKNSLIKDLTSINSKMFHIAVLGSDNTTIEHVTIDAPGNSVNTDGIHLGRINGFNIRNTNINTGDDCISFGDGSKNVHVEKVTCGRGHGISIGSLGRYPNEEPIEGIWVKNCTIAGTDNGVRIKSWPASFPGKVNDVHFQDIVMDNVKNPILIDQNYCPGHVCKSGGGPAKTGGPSKVKITNVSFERIKGTSSTKVAMKLNCSAVSPCDSVELGDINLTYNGVGQATATSQCFNVKPKVVGQIVPPACPDAPQHTIL